MSSNTPWVDSLSIHDLSGRSTLNQNTTDVSDFFQFTTSRGGRRDLKFGYTVLRKLSIHDLSGRSTEDFLGIQGILTSFNSRPLGEVDRLSSHHTLSVRYLSIHDLSGRSTHFRGNVAFSWHPFNSRPLGEVD